MWGWVYVGVFWQLCGCFGNMCTCIYCVLFCLYCFCIVSFMYIPICFVYTSVRATVTEWKLNCSSSISSSSSTTTNNNNNNNEMLDSINWENSGTKWSRHTFQYVMAFTWTEWGKSRKTWVRSSRWSGWNSNEPPPEYKSEKLRLRRFAWRWSLIVMPVAECGLPPESSCLF